MAIIYCKPPKKKQDIVHHYFRSGSSSSFQGSQAPAGSAGHPRVSASCSTCDMSPCGTFPEYSPGVNWQRYLGKSTSSRWFSETESLGLSTSNCSLTRWTQGNWAVLVEVSKEKIPPEFVHRDMEKNQVETSDKPWELVVFLICSDKPGYRWDLGETLCLGDTVYKIG